MNPIDTDSGNHRGVSNSKECGAITLVETLIVLTVGIVVLVVWAQSRLNRMEVDNAHSAGRAIATYARAAATWLAEDPPTADGIFSITDLQECSDPHGTQYLSCTFGAATAIPYAKTDSGHPVTYGDLEIDVNITPAGSLGLIDFGVFRSGKDRDRDGQPDSRPDLAAAAFQTATEETGAGVMDFFELVFAQTDPATVILDPTHQSFDQTAVDNLARIQARVGSRAANDAPFLRLDGNNEMSGALNFENGMQVKMDEDHLVVEGPGDVAIQTATGGLKVSGQVDADGLQVSSAAINQLRVDPLDGLSGDGFKRLNQAPDVIRIDNEMNSLSSRVTVNAGAIRNNQTAITNNRGEINKNIAEMVDLSATVGNNTRAIASNRRKINKNTSDIAGLDQDTETIETCTPSRASVIAANPGVLRCSSRCIECGHWKGFGKDFTYKSRNLQTLKCDEHTIKIYHHCCFVPAPFRQCERYCMDLESRNQCRGIYAP